MYIMDHSPDTSYHTDDTVNTEVTCHICGTSGKLYRESDSWLKFCNFHAWILDGKKSSVCASCSSDLHARFMNATGKGILYLEYNWNEDRMKLTDFYGRDYHVLGRSKGKGYGFGPFSFDIIHVWFRIPNDPHVWIGRHAGNNNTIVRCRRTKRTTL